MKIRQAHKIKGKRGESWEWIILGNLEVRGKVHRAKIDWQGQKNYSPPRPVIMEVGYIGRIVANPSWFWVVEEILPEESDMICEMCKEEHSDYKHYGHR